METLRQREIVSHSSRGQNNKPVSFSNVLGLKKYVFLLLVWVFVLGQVQITKAQRVNFQTSPYAADKLINSEDIMIGFEEGETRVKVIVNLVKPAEVLAATDWDSRASLNKLQAEILTRHEEVLSTLSHNEFMLRYRFENQAAFSGEITLEGLNKLLNNPRVESIEPVYFLEEDLAQGIPLINGMVYRSTYNGQGVAIAICDSGIDYTHPKLGGGGFPNSKVIGGYDFGDNDSNYYPNGAHGTCCAGIAAGDLGSTGDYIGGVAYNAKIYALKAKDSSGKYAHDKVIKAWNWCVTHKDDNPSYPILVISQSLSKARHLSTCDSSYPSYATAADNLTARGITILASSGNQGYCDSISSPSCLSKVISVGAVYDAAIGTYSFCVDDGSCATPGGNSSCDPGEFSTKQVTGADLVAVYSNTASFLDVLAPADDAYTTDIAGSGGYSPGDYRNDFGGTSAACPYAAGAVACLQSAAKAIKGRYLSPSEIRDILTSTGDNITDGKVPITKPRINLGKAIDSLKKVCCPITISSFPYAEGFEADFGYWVNAGGDDTDWTRRTGSTPSTNTGPSSAYEGSYYLYIESTSNNPNKRAVLDGPCFDLSSLSDPQLRFWYHMYGTSMGVLTVKVSDDNCANWTTVWTLSGNQGNDWYEAIVDLSVYSGSTIKIQFVGVTGSSYTSDMAIDDVHLEDYVPQPQPPVAEDGNVVTQVDTPVTITLNATDDGYPDPPGILTYIVTSLPSDGTLSDPSAGDISSVPYTLVNNGNQVVYTPGSGYTGTDSFQFKANDGGVPPDGGDSNVATVSMEVSPPTVEYQVGSSYDDAYAYGSTSQVWTAAYLKVGYTSTYGVPYYMSGVRFTNVNIPKGATIISAYLKIQSYTSDLTSSVYGKIQAEATDDADAFNVRYIADLAKTSASVNWDHTTSWSSNTWYPSPNIAGVVQEVIDRSGWSPNNSLAIFYSTRTASGGYRWFSSYDRGSSYAPKLEITYIVPQPTISGYVRTSGGSGISGVTMTGWPGTASSDGWH
ncbi:MAG: S8 family serine peptidase, partial [Desulfobacteraceae bacterium]|nr:S8 family serine peptidase [Desulfobacteraceae bacterium]